MRHLFGTDGIRGEAGVPPLDGETVSRIGRALVQELVAEGAGLTRSVVVGCDTRESSQEIVEALAGGIAAAGGTVSFAGVVPTPAVAFLVQDQGAAAGVVVSASHNPWRDNGVKIFSARGQKLPDATEAGIERLIGSSEPSSRVPTAARSDLAERYVEHLVGTLPQRLDGLTVVIDGANGAAFHVAPRAFREAGATVIELHTRPDGRNINDGCGALHPGDMARRTAAGRADLGIALDGDADRIVIADSDGRLLDGDDILLLWTLELIREGRKPDAVVGTVMSNWGLEQALSALGVRLVRAPVGDRYVVQEMERHGARLGGEPSGHLIHRDLTTTGDGTLTGLHLAALVAASGRELSAQPRISRTPQVLLNVRVKERVPFDQVASLTTERTRCEALLNGKGRILLRYSGTEPLARVMVEGTEAAVVDSVARSLARTIELAIGI